MCATGTVAILPRDATATLFVRPQAIFSHSRLGPILARSNDAAGEQALLERAERTGYDVRTLERAAIAWTPRGAVYVAHGPLDGARIAERLWERLISPRERNQDVAMNVQMEGMLGSTFVAALVAPACGLAAYAEGTAVRRSVERVTQANEAVDPDDLLVWRTVNIPSELAQATGSALANPVRAIEVRVAPRAEGISVSIRLDGVSGTDAPVRVRRAIAAVAVSPLGELAGAIQWLGDDRVTIRSDNDSVTASVMVPWRALSALADGIRGHVGRDRVD